MCPTGIERIVEDDRKHSFVVTINDDLTVRLNATGRKIWEESGLGKKKPIGEDGLLTDKIWIIMMVLGPYVHVGFELPFESTMIVTTDRENAPK